MADRTRGGPRGGTAASAAVRAMGLALSTLFLAGAASPATAQGAAPTGGRIVTMTRGMKVFGDAEYGLIQALATKDAAALDRLVGDDFEQRDGASPGTPVPRDEWLPLAESESSDKDRIAQMAVHDLPDLAIVSFLLQRPGRGDAFVIDVWRKHGADPAQLSMRYLSAAARPAAHASRRTKPASGPVVDTRR